ncbi:MAG: PLP-dependent cysteine synthase family protein [Brevinematia bacterium]
MTVANSIKDLIGKTPILRMDKISQGGKIFAKLEWYNIGGSVKDRLALYLIEYAEVSGKLDRNKTIIEATSGNTGIGLAMIAAFKGYKIDIVMPESVSIERRKIIKAYGANLILSPGDKGTGGAVELKRELLEKYPDKYVDLDQFKDPANILAHYQTTGKEIIEQMDGKVDMVVVGIGTAGTGVGVSMRLKEFNQGIKIIGVMPKLGVKIQGMRNPNEPNPTQLFRPECFDEIVEIENEEVPKTYEVAREVAKKEGLLVGMSAASLLYVAIKKSKELPSDKNIVVILPDSGMKYLSTQLFED